MKRKYNILIVGACWIAIHAVNGLSGPVYAGSQDAPGSPEAASAEPEEQVDEARSELDLIKRLHQAVREEIELDEEEAATIDRMFEESLERATEMAGEIETARRANADKVRDLREQISAARKEGDQAKLRDLRDRLRDMTSYDMKVRQARAEFDRSIMAKLSDGQASAYRRLANRIRRVATPARRVMQGIGTMHVVLRELDLTEAQETQFRSLMSQFGTSFAEARDDLKQRMKIVGDLRQGVLDLLTDSQRERYLELEKAQNEKADRGLRPGIESDEPDAGDEK